MQKQWEALIRRALCRASGQVPPKRGKHWKSKEKSENSESIQDNQNSASNDKLELKNLQYDTLFVYPSTDLKSLFESHFGPKTGDPLGKSLILFEKCQCEHFLIRPF